jgi:MFS-type transporter involved in bile tolerance (Atg22 family)
MHAGPARDARTAGKKTRLAWYAFDLGNTAVEFAIPLYLTIWIVSDLGVAAWVFGLASALSSWAIGLSGPYIGVHADETQTRRAWFTISVLASTVLFSALCFLPSTGTPALVAILGVAMAASYLFQLSSLIYNASMLRAAGGANVVSVSSLGLGLSFLGGLVGVGIIELVTSGRIIPGVSGRQYALVPAAVIFVACAIPSFLNDGLWQSKSSAVTITREKMHRRIWELWRESSKHHRVGWFLAGYFALNSSMMGLTLYLPLYVKSVTDLEGTSLLMAFGVVVLASAAGAGIVSVLRPTGLMVRRIVLVGLTLLAVNALVFSVVSALPLVIMCACLHGLFSGALAPTVRGAFALTFTVEYQALAFGLFGAVQRVSQGLGAALWPIAGMAGKEKAASWGIAAMGVLALIGVPLFSRSRLGGPAPSERKEQDTTPTPTEGPR